ncbi:MAG: hypothetical protein H0T42_28775 [Deltaproteobacteria bacterium]|nr:hypothetical protein [Deltaproteobacteria bacterium]
MRSLFVLVLALGACNTPSPSLRIRVTEGPTQSCATDDCAQVPLACQTWVGIRIIDPADRTAPFLSQCQAIQNGTDDLCAIARVELEPIPLPVDDLEVQVALFPASMITKDPMTGEDICPSNVEYDAVNGFPIENGSAPALGGRGYYRPGDEVVTVTLGCTNLELVNDPVCEGRASVRVAATVDDFDGGFVIDPNRIGVSIGAPKSKVSGGYELNPGDVTMLERTSLFPPAWGISLDAMFSSYACLAVLDDVPQSTTALTCSVAMVTDDDLSFIGIRLAKPSLDQILTSLSLAQFPSLGMTIGLVVDVDGKPVPNQTISVPPGTTIKYLSPDRMSSAGSATSGGPLGGVFVSLDAPFGTMFSTTNASPTAPRPQIGGRIDGKVSIVVLRFADEVVNP